MSHRSLPWSRAFKPCAKALGWYVAINVAAIGPYLVLTWLWATIAGKPCCDAAPTPIGLLGVLWGSLGLLALLLPIRARVDWVWLAAIGALAWLRMLGAIAAAMSPGATARPGAIVVLYRLTDGPLKALSMLLLVAYIAVMCQGMWSSRRLAAGLAWLGRFVRHTVPAPESS